MKTKTIKMPLYEMVEKGYKTITKYVTDDGEEFENRKDALNHENNLRYDAIENFKLETATIFRTTCDFLDFPKCYRAKTEEELFFLRKYLSSGWTSKIYGELKVGEWFLHYYEDNIYFSMKDVYISFDYLKKELSLLLIELQSK